MPRQTHLADMFTDIIAECKGSKITIGKMVEAMNHKGFGALLLAPTIINVLPTGGIPGVPAVCNTVIILICVQLLIRRPHPWFPEWINKITFSSEKLKFVFDKAKPVITFIDRFTVRRFDFLCSKFVSQIIALICIALASVSYVLEFIPFAAFPPAFAILAFALGLTLKDGAFTILGFVLAAINLVIIPQWIF